MQNPMQMIQMFNQFRSNFQGDARAKVQELMNNGQMSQAQFNQLQQQATQFMNMMNTMKK